jgi:glycosyltransferase involved in cell wall biosynthesis
VIVPTRGRSQLLARTIPPLLADHATLELLLVVDGADDETAERAAASWGSDRRVIVLPIERSGEMGARQAGLDHARGDVVLFMDDDVAAGPGLVSKHLDRHSRQSDLVVVGYHPARLRACPSSADFATVLYAGEYERTCAEYQRAPASVLLRLWAGNFSMRAETCRRVGLASPTFTERYHPDRDFGLRCLDAGLDAVFDRRLWGAHLHSRTTNAFLTDSYNQGAGRMRVHTLHGDLVGPLPTVAFEEGLGRVARGVVRLGRRPRVQRPLRAAARCALHAAVRSHSLAGALAVARLSRRIEQQAGAFEALDRSA